MAFQLYASNRHCLPKVAQVNSAQETRRAALRDAEDDQSRATRLLLIAAYEQAAAAKLARPSVTWLCERAGVGRSTFYTHFASVEDLAIATITASFEPIATADTDRRRAHSDERRAIARDGLSALIESIERTRSVLDYTVQIGSRAAVLDRLIEEFAHYTRETIAVEYDHLDAARRDIVTEYVSAGTAHTVLQWVEGRMPVSRSDLIERLVDVLPAPLTRHSDTTS